MKSLFQAINRQIKKEIGCSKLVDKKLKNHCDGRAGWILLLTFECDKEISFYLSKKNVTKDRVASYFNSLEINK